MSDISAVNPYAAMQPSAPASSAAGAADDLGADVFLQLLVAQLKYQDPTSPADGTEFLAQTAQFTMVEKLSQLADAAEAASVRDRNLAAATMVGRGVEWLNADGTTGSGVVESARLGSAGPVLVVDGVDVAFDAVSAVTATAPAVVAAPAPSSPAPSSPAPTTTSQTTDGSPATSATDGTTAVPTSVS